jgi:hypothetical protein
LLLREGSGTRQVISSQQCSSHFMKPFVPWILLIFYLFPVFDALKLPSIMGQAISSTQFFLYGKKHFTK